MNVKVTISDILLGEGYSARVYKGYMENRTVAVKTFKNSRQSREQFHQEVSVLRQLSHPCIPKILGYGGEPHPRLILDYCHGVTLARALKTQSVSKASVPCIVKNLLQVIDYLHSLRILYRDMKPSNVMLTVSTDRHHPLQVHVVDFGFAVVLPHRRQSLRDCHVVGTQGFMAPEISRENRYSRASDMFALGKTFACLLEPSDPWWPLLVEACTLESARKRPTASQCVEELMLY